MDNSGTLRVGYSASYASEARSLIRVEHDFGPWISINPSQISSAMYYIRDFGLTSNSNTVTGYYMSGNMSGNWNETGSCYSQCWNAFSTSSDCGSIAVSGASSFYLYDITSGFKNWKNGATNHGFMLKASNVTESSRLKTFATLFLMMILFRRCL